MYDTVIKHQPHSRMRSIQQFFLGVSLIGVLCGLFGNATSAFACSCAGETPVEQFDNATAVFVGTVKSISEDGGEKFVDFDVHEVQKGLVAESATVSNSLCGVDFAVGQEYSVYARGQGQLYTNACTGTALLVARAEDGSGENNITNNPETLIAESDNEDNSMTPFVVALLSFAVGALVVYLVGCKKAT